MVRIFDADTHLFKGEDCVFPHIGSGITRRQVEVTSLVQRDRTLRILEIEIFELRSYIEGITLIGSTF